MNGLGDLKPSTINARIAASTHLLKWIGHVVPDWIQRPSRSRSLPKTLGKRELARLWKAIGDSEDPLAMPICTILLDTGLRCRSFVHWISMMWIKKISRPWS